MGFALQYSTLNELDDLIALSQLGHCTIRRCVTEKGRTFWRLWFYVERETDRVPELFSVFVNPNGSYLEWDGEKIWGLKEDAGGVWQISPSIDVYDDEDARRVRAGLPRHDKSLWHQTPSLVYVPTNAPWITEAP